MPKFITAIGLTGKKEVSYNAGGSLSLSTDGILLDEPLKIPASYANDGGRPAPPSILGNQRRVVPSGRSVNFPIKVSAKGSGAAYSASVVPSAVHILTQIAGFDGVVSTTGGSESWTYTPTPITGTPSSGVLNAYGRGQLYPLTGAYADLTIDAQGPVVPTWTYGLQALMASAISDVSLPTIVYPALTTDPPKATNITFTLGNLTAAVVRKFTLKMGRQMTPRLNINASSGHAGFAPNRRAPTLDVTFESTALTTTPFTTSTLIDPYQLYEAATNVACSLQIGSVQYNKYTITAGAAQIMAPPVDDEDGGVSLVTLSLQLNPTTLANNDDVTILFN